MTDQKNKIIEKGIKSIPKFVWIICGSYALTVITTVLALNFAHIDADKHINRYFDILLSREEVNNCKNPINKSIIDKINQNSEDIVKLKVNSHSPK
jgi:hypothetical protein